MNKLVRLLRNSILFACTCTAIASLAAMPPGSPVADTRLGGFLALGTGMFLLALVMQGLDVLKDLPPMRRLEQRAGEARHVARLKKMVRNTGKEA